MRMGMWMYESLVILQVICIAYVQLTKRVTQHMHLHSHHRHHENSQDHFSSLRSGAHCRNETEES